MLTTGRQPWAEGKAILLSLVFDIFIFVCLIFDKSCHLCMFFQWEACIHCWDSEDITVQTSLKI